MKTITLKKVAMAISIVVATNATYAQRNCGTMTNQERLEKQSIKYKQKRLEYEQVISNYLQASKTTTTSITIPVVVHVVYNTTAQNISVAQIQSQIDAVNEDYGRTNADTVNTPGVWKSISANTGIQFCLAQRDPSGNPTTGIERRQSTVTSFTTDDKVKSYATGGLGAWDPTKYINIWVCNMGGGLLGYGEFPTGTVSNTYGVVIQYNAFGRVGTVSAPYDKGRTLTHEFSHCFNLYHIWGDDGGACTGSDLVNDTPNQADATSGCFTFPKTDACATAAPGIMFMNYMDYSNDNCLNMFTQGQSTRMNAVLNVAPYNALATSNGCVPVNLQSDDAGIVNIITPSNNICSTTFTPQVTIKNWGTSSLTSAIINYHIDSNPVQTYTYSGSLASLATANVTLPSMATTSGSHTFMAFTTLPNGMADMNTTNDTTMMMFNVITSGQSLPFSEGFEGTTFVPMGWMINNADAADTWVRTTSAAKTGVASAVMDNFTNQFTGSIDELEMPALDLTTVSGPQLTFQVAYKLYTNPATSPNYSDTLEVLISTDCGNTYSSIYKKFGTNLPTTTPVYANSAFTPTSSQWRMESVSLISFASSQNAIIKFRNISDYENFLYLDDINISGTTGIKSNTVAKLIDAYPNPNNGVFNIAIKNNSVRAANIYVTNALGEMVFNTENKIIDGVYKLDLSSFGPGIYFLKVENEGSIYQSKVIINK